MAQLSNYVCIIATMALILFSSSAHTDPNPGEDTKSITVRMQIYSSRSDPSYELKQGSEEVDRIKTFIEKSPIIDFKRKRTPPRLGYHGMMIDNPERVSGLPGHVLIYNGIIEMVHRNREYRSDQDRVLERFLIKEAEKAHVVDGNLLKQTGIDISTGG